MRHSVEARDGVVVLRMTCDHPDDDVDELMWPSTARFTMIPEDAGRLAGELLDAAKAADDAA